jgi:hypothetical protein
MDTTDFQLLQKETAIVQERIMSGKNNQRCISARNLKQTRAFYLTLPIPQTLSAEFVQIPTHMHFLTIAHYALEGLPNKVLAAEYRTVLPDADQIAAELTKATKALEARRKGEEEYSK